MSLSAILQDQFVTYYRKALCQRDTPISCRPVSILSMPSVRPSVTRRYCVKMASKRWHQRRGQLLG